MNESDTIKITDIVARIDKPERYWWWRSPGERPLVATQVSAEPPPGPGFTEIAQDEHAYLNNQPEADAVLKQPEPGEEFYQLTVATPPRWDVFRSPGQLTKVRLDGYRWVRKVAEPEPEETPEPADIGPEADKLPVGAQVEIDVEWTAENDWLRNAQYIGMSGSPDDPALQSLMFGYEGVGGEEEGEFDILEYISPKEWDELYAPHVISITGGDGEVLWKRESPDQEDLTEEERAMRLNRIHISPAIITKLAENEPRILSLGDLVDWQREKGDFWAKDLKGIGPKAREAIEEALMKFWEERGKKE